MRDFAATDGLDDGALLALLAGGRVEERVWAGWRIALRRGAAMPEIVAHVRGEPSAGVRRALLPVLVGHGELDVLVALGRHDPSAEVRASAMQLVTRIAGQGAIPVAVVVEAFDADAAVRVAILAAIAPGAPDALRALIVRSLGDAVRPRDERLEAFEAALRIGAHAAGVRWLAAAGGELADDSIARLLDRDRAEVVAILAAGDPTLRVRLRDRLVHRAAASPLARRLLSMLDRRAT